MYIIREKLNRRRFIATVSTLALSSTAGCFGILDDSDGDGSTDTPTDTATDTATDTPTQETTTTTTDAPTETGGSTTTTTSSASVFESYGVEGRDLVVTLTSNGASSVTELRAVFPSGEETTEVSGAITRYPFDVTEVRAGRWQIAAYDSNENVVESVELNPEFTPQITEIGTLTELGVTGRSPDDEQVGIQFTLTNEGGVPFEPDDVTIQAPELDPSEADYSLGNGDYLTDIDDEQVITPSEENTYRFEPYAAQPQTFLTFRLSENQDLLGTSIQAVMTIDHEARRGGTTVPLTINIGDTPSEDSGFVYAEGTTIELQSED